MSAAHCPEEGRLSSSDGRLFDPGDLLDSSCKLKIGSCLHVPFIELSNLQGSGVWRAEPSCKMIMACWDWPKPIFGKRSRKFFFLRVMLNKKAVIDKIPD